MVVSPNIHSKKWLFGVPGGYWLRSTTGWGKNRRTFGFFPKFHESMVSIGTILLEECTRILPFLVGNPFKASFVTVTSEGIIHQVVLIFLGHFFFQSHLLSNVASLDWAKNFVVPLGGCKVCPLHSRRIPYGVSNRCFLNLHFGTWNVLVMFRMGQLPDCHKKSFAKTKSHRCQHLLNWWCFSLWFWEGIFAIWALRRQRRNASKTNAPVGFNRNARMISNYGVLNVC